MLQKVLDWVRGEVANDTDWPMCPRHDTRLKLVKKIGQPARFMDQETETYTLMFHCPVEECDEQATRQRVRTQIPVPGEQPQRPPWAERDRRSL